tara:strand:- start:29472 stop:29726 length:255 start_codon:yes stop_codon:yes gene_type:complete
MNRIIIVILSLFLIFNTILAGYHCSSPTNCVVTCSNYGPSALKSLEGTDWHPVLYDTGTCYFHNRKTREDQGELPVKKIKTIRL